MIAGCVQGAACVGAPLTCAPYAGLDESCDAVHPCGRSLYCVSGKCVLFSDAGPCVTANGLDVPCAPQLVTLREDGRGLCACVAPQPVNAPCAAPTAPLAATLACAAGTYCAGDSATPGQGRCSPRAAEGQPCIFNLSALQTSACSDADKDYCTATATSSGTCLPLPAAGQPCTGNPDAGALSSIERGRCAAGTACNQAMNPPTCLAAPGIGQPCSASTFGCVDGSYCDGVCKPNPTAGQSCGQTVNGRSVVCADGLYCRAGLCAPLPKIGESCGDVPHFAVRCADGGFCQLGAQDASACVSWCQ